MGDIGDKAISNKKRDYPAWGYLLLGAVFLGVGVVLISTGAMEDSRKPLTPWLGVFAGLVFAGLGVREWARNGSPTARRVKSREEVERDAERNREVQRWNLIRLGVGLVVLVVIVVLALVL